MVAGAGRFPLASADLVSEKNCQMWMAASYYGCCLARVAELADALDLGSSTFGCAGSTPVPGIFPLTACRP